MYKKNWVFINWVLRKQRPLFYCLLQTAFLVNFLVFLGTKTNFRCRTLNFIVISFSQFPQQSIFRFLSIIMYILFYV